MRLDLFLKASRLTPRRTVAQKICDAGRVSVNGHPAKSAHPVKTGDEIVIRTRTRIITARVLHVPSARQTSRKEAATLVEIVSEGTIEDDLFAST